MADLGLGDRSEVETMNALRRAFVVLGSLAVLGGGAAVWQANWEWGRIGSWNKPTSSADPLVESLRTFVAVPEQTEAEEIRLIHVCGLISMVIGGTLVVTGVVSGPRGYAAPTLEGLQS